MKKYDVKKAVDKLIMDFNEFTKREDKLRALYTFGRKIEISSDLDSLSYNGVSMKTFIKEFLQKQVLDETFTENDI
jgi:sulfur transfer protein SufE